jgi:large subunit ribosomal protein L24
MAHGMKIRKGDLVQVLSGKDRGKQGRIIEADPRKGRVMVENLNLVKKHR